MRYYKILNNDTFIGVITSNNFMRYQESNNMFIGANEQTGDLVECKNKLYRAMWMKPINNNINLNYEIAEIKEISKEDYIIVIKAEQANDEIIEDPIPAPIPQPEEPQNQNELLEFIRSSKINEMSYACRTTIEQGFDIELRGESCHFSLSTQDQLNLMNLNIMAQTQELVPYHADGEACEFYTAAEINQIVKAANDYKIYHTTYFNALKEYINALETIEEIAAITYGTPIPEEYKSDVLRVLE